MITLKLVRIGAMAALATLIAGGARAAGSDTQNGTAYQINPAHSGGITFNTAFKPPLKTVWSIKFGGAVSYPIVANGMVFVTVADSPAGSPLLVALDLPTGQIVWQKAVAAGYLAYDRQRLFFTDFSGPLQAFASKDGRPLWSTQLPGQYYFNFVPIAFNGFVYTGGSESGTTVYQVDETNGKVGWTKSLDAGGVGATFGIGQIYFSVPCDIPAFAAATGKVNWNYSSGCDGGGGALDAYYRGRVYDPYNSVVLNATTGKVVGGLTDTLPAFYGNNEYVATRSGVLAQTLTTGDLVWEWSTKDTLVTIPIVVNGTVFVAGSSGSVYALDGTSGALLQTLTPGAGGGDTANTLTGLGAGQGYLVAPTGNVLSAFAP